MRQKMRQRVYRVRQRVCQEHYKRERNVPLTDRQKTTLRRKRYDLRSLSKTKTPLTTKRKILQKGGFLSAILPPVLSVLGGLLLNSLR